MKRWMELKGQALVLGCNGIGGAMVGHLLHSAPGLRVTAGGRTVQKDTHPLQALRRQFPDRLTCREVDVTAEESLKALKEALSPSVKEEPLRLIVNCAGFLHDENIKPEKQLKDVTTEALRRALEVNAMGPILLAKTLESLIPPVKKAGADVVWFASLSARVGSISDNKMGGWYSYRAGKSAQNQLLKTLAIEWARTRKQVCVGILHPGTVATELSKPFSANVKPDKLFTPDKSARCLLDVLTALGPADSGSYVDWEGKQIPW